MLELTRVPILSAPMDRSACTIFGNKFTVLLAGTECGADYTIIEMISPVQGGGVPHFLKEREATYFLIEGELELVLPHGKSHHYRNHTMHIPKNTPHSITSVGKVPARMLIITSPPGLEFALRELGKLSDTPNYIDEAIKILEKHGVIMAERLV